jgi:LysM repeat protein
VVIVILALALPVSAQAAGRTYVVKCGDTLTSIAARTGTTVWAIVRANGLRNPNYIWVGQVLIIPGPGGTPPPYGCGSYYVVRRGDTLSQIGRLFGTSAWAIASANGLRNANYIWAGQRLYIPCGGGGAAWGRFVHIVRRGDTLYSIARRYGTCVQAIMRANGIRNANYIWVGQRLIIPSS